MAKIAVVGLGNMGRPMGLNLQKAGGDVSGWDLSPKARDAYVTAGGRIANGLEAALDGADALVTMIPGRLRRAGCLSR